MKNLKYQPLDTRPRGNRNVSGKPGVIKSLFSIVALAVWGVLLVTVPGLKKIRW